MTTTEAPARADACYTWNRTLLRGMSGADVKQLQIRVAGWMSSGENLALDGDFGPATEAAVRRFQNGYGLSADGVAGSQTFSKIYALQDADCTPIHFDHSEFNYSCGERDYTGGAVDAATAKENTRRVMWQLEALRHKLGDRPIAIGSGFRSYACNSSVGGASDSRHLYGTAADLGTGSGPTLCQMASAARNAGFDGIFGPGYPGHNDHTHVDNRSGQVWSAPNCGI
ncbi:MAG TPA: M15 family metallopeptidase [Pseudonocardiaceae bacterium]|nr:M15 family metallopeptidase [Pseudonocardiaceae bacterium]